MRNHPLYLVLGLAMLVIVAGDMLFPDGVCPHPLAQAPQNVRLEAVVCAAPRPAAATWQADIRPVDGDIRLRLTAPDSVPRPHVGDLLSIVARTTPANVRKAGDTADTAYHHPQHLYLQNLRHSGITATAFATRIVNRGESPDIRLTERLLRHRETLTARYSGALGTDLCAVMAAMTLGDRTLLTADRRQIYSLTGSSHVLALSGLHLGVLVALLYLLFMPLRLLRFGHLLTILALVLCCWSFVLLAGMPLSLVRAASMLTLALFTTAFSHYIPPSSSIPLAVLLVLAVSPGALFDVGFQLSVTAVAAIVRTMRVADALPYRISYPFYIAFPRLRHRYYLRRRLRLHRLQYPLPQVLSWPARYLGSLLLASAAAATATMPLVLHNFGMMSVTGLFAALVAVPTALLMVCGGLFYQIFPALHATLAPVLGWLYHLQSATLEYLAARPWGCLHLRLTLVGMLAAYVALAYLMFCPWWRTRRRLILALCALPAVWFAELSARFLSHLLRLPL